jgi:hypothetical protein
MESEAEGQRLINMQPVGPDKGLQTLQTAFLC